MDLIRVGEESSDKKIITNWAVSIAITAIIFSIISPFINNFLKNNSNYQLIGGICERVFNIKDEQIRQIFYASCLSISDRKISFYETTDILSKAFNLFSKNPENFYSNGIKPDQNYRDQRIKNNVSYGIDQYISSIKKERFINSNDKPVGYFIDVYEPNKYNEEQKVLLEQAKYSEENPDDSSAQKILGPKRNLSYVGLKFPYGSNLTTLLQFDASE